MGTLYLIPTPIGRQKENHVLPEHTIEVVRKLDRFIVENIRTAQGFLQWVGHPLKPYEPQFRVLTRKTPEEEIYSFLELLRDGDAGLMSEAGAPAVADPGAKLVRMAHDAGHRVVPLTGPSSILLALMASGLNGQQFAFHGYLPVDAAEKEKRIRQLESESASRRQTQIFIESPHRNEALLNTLLEICRPETRLSVAVHLTLPDEQILSMPVHRWKKTPLPRLNGRPALFLFLAEEG